MGILEKIELPVGDRQINGTNKDLLPTPQSERTWNYWKYISTWAGPSFDINQWNTGASFITVGLTISQATMPVIVGSFIATMGLILMGLPGARYHVGYPSLIRTTYGTSGQKVMVGIRGLVGVIWYAVEAYYISTMLNVMFRCVVGVKYTEWAAIAPESAKTDAKTLISYFITWILIFPLVLIHPSKLDRTFVARSILGPLAYISLFAWCAHLGYSSTEGFHGFSNVENKVQLTGGALGMAMVSGVNSIMGTISPQMSSVSDITRYAKSPDQVGWQQGLGFFTTKVISIFLAIFSASFLNYRYGGAVIWNVWDQLGQILDNEWSPATRAGCFFIALGFGFSSTTTNAYANTVPFGADISALFPKLFDMRRGQILIAILSLAVMPWMLFSSGAKFLNFLGSYSFFMASIVGPFFIDWAVIRRGNIHIPSLYRKGNPADVYTYNRFGVNWRGFAGFGAGVIMILPGLVASYLPSQADSAATKMYNSGWVLSAVTSATVYYILCKVWPPKILPDGNEEYAKSLKFWELAETDGMLPHESGLEYMGGDIEEGASQEEKKDYSSVEAVPVM